MLARLCVCVCVCVCVCAQGLAQLEILCKQLYETTDTAVRHQAEKALVEFTNSTDCLSKCQLLLERGSVSSTHLFLPSVSQPACYWSPGWGLVTNRGPGALQLRCSQYNYSSNQIRKHPQ